MTEVKTNPRDEELESLKAIADRLGIQYSNRVGIETLKARIAEVREAEALKEESAVDQAKLRAKIRNEELKLIRIRLNLMNPHKKGWRGEIFTIANPIIGTVKKFVPFDPEYYTNGYHVPNCIYKMLKERKFTSITTKGQGTMAETTVQDIPEFAIEILPPLTKEELAELAAAQLAGNRIDQN